MFDAVLFDLDGTLVDSKRLWIEAIGVALERRGVKLSPAAATALVLGRSWPDIFAEVRRCYPETYATREAMEAIAASTVANIYDLAADRPCPNVVSLP